MTRSRQESDLAFWRMSGTLVLICGFASLGMPLDGIIPIPRISIREIVEVSYRQKVLTAVLWAGLYGFVALFCVIHAKRVTVFMRAQRPLLVLVLWLLLSALWSDNPGAALLALGQVGGSIAFGATMATLFADKLQILVRSIAVALAVSLVINVSAVVLWPGRTMDFTGRWAGVTGNPNYLGALAASFGIACIIVSVHSTARNLRVLGLVGVLGATYVVARSGSATSLLSGAAAVAIAAHLWMTRAWPRRSVVRYALVAAYVGVAAVIFRIVSVESQAATLGKDVTLTGRWGIWRSAFDLIGERPFAGHGYGSDTLSLGVLPWATTFHNGYLEVGVKGGLVAFALMLWWVVRLYACLRKDRGTVRADIGQVCLTFVVVYNLTESAFLTSRSPVWMMMIVLIGAVTTPFRWTLANAGASRTLGSRLATGPHDRIPRQSNVPVTKTS